jgi:hypothetical protein
VGAPHGWLLRIYFLSYAPQCGEKLLVPLSFFLVGLTFDDLSIDPVVELFELCGYLAGDVFFAHTPCALPGSIYSIGERAFTVKRMWCGLRMGTWQAGSVNLRKHRTPADTCSGVKR